MRRALYEPVETLSGYRRTDRPAAIVSAARLRGCEEVDRLDIAGNPSPSSLSGRYTCKLRRSIALSRREGDGGRGCRLHPLIRFLHTLRGVIAAPHASAGSS